jgi:uncharacterized protein with PIN domain
MTSAEPLKCPYCSSRIMDLISDKYHVRIQPTDSEAVASIKCLRCKRIVFISISSL